MFFLMECRHHPGKDADRDRLRPAHRDWVKTGGGGLCSVLIGSALWADDGLRWGIGVSWRPTPPRPPVLAAGDPFAREGVVEATAVTRLADTFMADRISPRMTV